MRILLVAGDHEAREVAAQLRATVSELELEEISDEEGLRRALTGPRPDVLVTGDRPGWGAGPAVMLTVREAWPGLPAVMLTADGSETAAVTALRAGFDDYFYTSEHGLDGLAPALERLLERDTARRGAVQAEARYREIFESLPVALYMSFADGVLLGANPAMAQLLGCPDRNALLGTNMADLYAEPEARQRWVERVLDEGVVYGFEVQLKRFDGRRIWVRETARAVWGEDGQTVVFQGMLEDVSERRAAESALRESEGKYRTLFESAKDSIFLLDGDRFVDCNLKTVEMFGGSAIEILGRRWLDFSPADQPDGSPSEESARARVEAALGGEPQFFDWQHRRPGGELFDAEVGLSRVDLVGNAYLLGIVRDVTDRKRAQQALNRRSEELELLNRVNELLARVLDAKTVMQEIADTVRRHCGVEHVSVALVQDEGEQLNFVAWSGYEAGVRDVGLKLHGPGLVARVARERRPAYLPDVSSSWIYLCGDQRVRSEYAVPLRSGGEVLGVLNCESFRVDGIGEADRALIDRLAAQAAVALRNAEIYRRLEAVLKSLPAGVLLLDGNRQVLLANPVASQALAVLDPDWDGESVDRLGSVKLAQLLEGGGTEVPVEIPVGESGDRLFEARVSKIGHRDGGAWVLLLRELTAEREARRQLEVQERLAAVGQLAAGIAHDLNNMLQAVMLNAELARASQAPDDPVVARIEAVREQCTQGAGLIRQVLDFARQSVAEAGPMELVPFVKESVKLLKSAIPESVQVKLDLGRGGLRVEADPVRMQQLLTNLAMNASEAMPAGGELRITLDEIELAEHDDPPAPEMEPGWWVVLSVADSGEGMSPEVRRRAFEPFFTTKGPGRGTGLGLAQVDRIVSQYNGFVTVDSEEGQGSSFTVYLPAASGDRRVERDEAAAVEELPRGHGELVLVVEDSRSVLLLARDGLERLGYRVQGVVDGLQALDEVDRLGEEIALVLTDMVMPGVGGLELARRLAERDLPAKVVLMTGYPVAADDDEHSELGIVGWLHKPFTLAQLAETVDRALRGELATPSADES